jgi:ATP/maltotriose-dependent transcriptional regulator MalT/DNA-binding SARP family transcriptional activator
MAEFIPVTRTKIILPKRRAELLSRKRLLELLDELLDNRLVIVAAPAGYGKTSLLVDFASANQWPFCWYALDTLDQDPQRFIAHFISALSLRFPKFGKSCMSALQSMSQDRLDLDVMVSLIVNDAYENITEHFILVLDDFHLVESSRPVVYFVNRFIQDVDENCHLVLASRALLTLPDLPLMVARAQVGGLGFDDLCFQPDEIQRLLEQNYQLKLSADEAESLARETEGWVTGLLLSTQVMGKRIANQQRLARVSGVGLYEYLAQQVLAQQAEPVQEFLLRSALLDEFDIHTCEDVIGKALSIQVDWRELMDAVMRLNLFVLPVGEDGMFIRYHHLFQDFLRDRMRRERPGEAQKILLRLAEMYAEREDWERSYHIYQAAGDVQAVVRLLERAGSAMIVNGRVITLSDWLASLPEDLLGKHPALLSLQGTVAFERGDVNQGLHLLDQAVTGLWPGGEPLQLAQTLCRRSVANRFAGQYRAALDDADEAITLLSSLNQNSVIYADALASKGTVYHYLGQLLEALALLKKALEVYQSLGDENSAAKAWMEIGSLSKKLGKYTDAEQAYNRALEYSQATGNIIWQANLYNNLGVLQHANGDYVTATSSFERAIHYAKLGGSPRLEAYALTSIGDLYQELEAVQETQEAYRQAREVAQRVRDGYLLFYLNLVETRLKKDLKEDESARALLESAEKMARERGSQYELNICRIERGRFKLSENKLVEAYEDFLAALAFLNEEGYQVEIPRARLYALVTAWLLKHPGEVQEQVDPLLSLFGEAEKRKLLIAAGRELLVYLEKLRGEPLTRKIVLPLLEKIDEFNQALPGIRRMVRRHAGVVPFAPPKMVIRAFGKTQIKVSDHLITSSEWQVQTARDLFLILLAHPEGLTKEQIGEYFWPDSTPSELKLRFKNTIYRLRHAAGKDAILFQGENLYLFNRSMDYEYDVELFQKEISLADKADSREQRDTHYQNALRTYRGPYLPDLDDDWVIVERERQYQAYMNVLLKLASLCMNARDYQSALNYCQRAIKEDPCQEDAHRIAMRIYAAMGNRAFVIRQYEQCRLALLNEVDAPPSFQTQALYESLIQ